MSIVDLLSSLEEAVDLGIVDIRDLKVLDVNVAEVDGLEVLLRSLGGVDLGGSLNESLEVLARSLSSSIEDSISSINLLSKLGLRDERGCLKILQG